jgi:ubiquinone/menaquinone biosynthesis C-methylase UbiE
MKRILFKIYWRIEKIIAPQLVPSQRLYEDVLEKTETGRTRWLDVGCGHRLLPDWRAESERTLVQRAASIVGVDPDAQSISKHRTITDVRLGKAEELPFPPGSFNLVTANMVAEHLQDPAACLQEIHRVLEPGGTFIFHTPNAKSVTVRINRSLPDSLKKMLAAVLESRKSEDVYPTHYRLNDEAAIQRAAEKAGFEMRHVSFTSSVAIFSVIFPVAIIELLWIRLTLTKPFRRLRSNLIVTLTKPA